MTIWKAILAGWLVVNGPATAIIVGFIILGIKIVPSFWPLMGLIGVLLGWTWWSFSVPRWRRWAHRNGVDRDKLQTAAVATGLVWPKGWIFEKTEFKVDE
jgi:hypothetical protein